MGEYSYSVNMSWQYSVVCVVLTVRMYDVVLLYVTTQYTGWGFALVGFVTPLVVLRPRVLWSLFFVLLLFYLFLFFVGVLRALCNALRFYHCYTK